MTLHIFNPEHDIALAANLANFTAPHAGRQLRHDLGFLPALWAGDGDAIAVDDIAQAKQCFARFSQSVKRHLGISISRQFQWVAMRPSASWQQVGGIVPWGWDLALRARLLRCGADGQWLPSEREIAAMRLLSHRRTAAALLPELQCAQTVGEAFECTAITEIEDLLQRYGHIVLKAPWSSSGRGIRFVSAPSAVHSPQMPAETDNAQSNYSLSTISYEMACWLNNLFQRQGSVMVEPYYNKVKDFGMEFWSDGRGTVTYLGLSLFHTANGAYTGNIIATEAAKRDMMSRYLPLSLLDTVQEKICKSLGTVFNGKYRGPFGVDMMIVHSSQSTDHSSQSTVHSSKSTVHSSQSTDQGAQPNYELCTMNYALSLHPCVEINLRRTMGHAALALTPTDDEVRRVMRIEYADNSYKLRLNRMK